MKMRRKKKSGRLDKKIFRASMVTVITSLSIFTLMMVAQGIFISNHMGELRETLLDSSQQISSEYRSLTDRALTAAASKHAAEADEILSDCETSIQILAGFLDHVLKDESYDGTPLSPPDKEAPKGQVSSYYMLTQQAVPSSAEVQRDLEVLAEAEPFARISVNPKGPIYSCSIVTDSGAVLFSNNMESLASMRSFIGGERIQTLFESYPATCPEGYPNKDDLLINLHRNINDPITGQKCLELSSPIYENRKLWGIGIYYISYDSVIKLVNTDVADEEDICFITADSGLGSFLSSDETGIFRTMTPEEYEKEGFEAAEPEAAKKLTEAFEGTDRGKVTLTLNQAIAGSKDITFYFSRIKNADSMFVIARSEAVTADSAETVNETLMDIGGSALVMLMRYILLTIGLFLLSSAIAWALTYILSKRFSQRLTRPIRTLTEKAEAINADSLDFSWESMGDDEDETEILAHSFEMMTKRIREDIDKMTEMTSAREKLEAELSLASGIQSAMLPSLDDFFTGSGRFSLYASMVPAREVGGDFYDFFMLPDGRLAFLVADVSDKGIAAALFMSRSMTVIRTLAAVSDSPSDVLKKANAQLIKGNDSCMFVTVFLAFLNPDTGEMTAADAGHCDPAVYRRSNETVSGFSLLACEHGTPLALFEDAEFPQVSLVLSPGDRIFVYTDGISEAQTALGDQFGDERLLSVLDGKKDSSDEELCAAVSDEISRFMGDEPRFDDITMLCLTKR